MNIYIPKHNSPQDKTLRLNHLLLSVFIILIFSNCIFSITELNQSDVLFDLDANVDVNMGVLDKPIDDINVLATVNNPTNKSFVMYLMRREDNNVYKPVESLGVLKHMSSMDINITLRISYPGKRFRNVDYLLLASNEKNEFHGYAFVIRQDWSHYENMVEYDILLAHSYLIPIGGLIIILILMILVVSAFHHRIPGVLKNEYTFRTLFFPIMKRRPFGERVADVFMTPIIWLIEIVIIVLMIFYMWNAAVDSFGVKITSQLIVLGGIVALVLPIFYFAVAWYLDTKPLRFFASLFLWGGAAAFISFSLNTMTIGILNSHYLGVVGGISKNLLTAVVIAPLIEETVKSIGLFIMSQHHEYDDRITGLIFGFTIGVGFAFIENWFYIVSKTNPYELGVLVWGQLILYRSFFNTLAHGIITGIGGAVIGYVKAHSKLHSYLLISFPLALLLIIPLHSLFNVSALIDSSQSTELIYGLPFIFNPMFVVLLMVIFVGIYVFTPKKSVEKELEEGEEIIEKKIPKENIIFTGVRYGKDKKTKRLFFPH
ncbi:PrsW family intramembrane metalloprotease [Candidatus Micrarchaeota archaeon]|nr:PrsW family intramembrane metalloprotease [Candidatus Micrarchaeota archaeon]